MKMIKLLKKELNNTKEEFSDDPWCFYPKGGENAPTSLSGG